MFTRNWYTLLATNFLYDYNTVKATSCTGSQLALPNLFPWFGNTSNSWQYPSVYYVKKSLNESGGGVLFGTGDAAPTMDDYKLDGDIISDFSYSAAVTKTFDDDNATVTALYTVTNTGTAPMTIKEIGLVVCGSSSNGAANRTLLERTVLETPITIEPGGVGQVTYTIRMNYPT